MTDLRTAAKQALEALLNFPDDISDEMFASIAALKAALAQEQAEPPTNQCGETCERAKLCAACARALEEPTGKQDLQVEPVQEQAEPVAWIDREGVLYKMHEIESWAPPHTMLYTAPTKRKPLTDEEILKAIDWERAEMYMKLTPNFPVAEAKKETLKNARAIERAHGIGETK